MSESVREQALAAYAALFAGMTGARHWGGSYETALGVERTFSPVTAKGDLPRLIVLPGSGSIIRQDDVNGGYRDAFRLLLYGYVRGDDVTSPNLWLERLWWDVFITVEANIGTVLDGRVSTIEWGTRETDEGDLGLDRLGAFAQELTVDITPVTLAG